MEEQRLEMALDAAINCISAASEVQRHAFMPLDQSRPTPLLIGWLSQACEMGLEAIAPVNDQLTAVADTSPDIGELDVYANWHWTAYQYAARVWAEVVCPEGRCSQVVGKDRTGGYIVSEVGLSADWPAIRASLLQRPRPDVKRLNHLLKQEAARAKLGIARCEGGPIRPGVFEWNGIEYPGLQSIPWLLVSYLWQQPQRRALWSSLAEPVWRDHGIEVDEDNFGSARKCANKFFERGAMPFRIKGRKAHGNDRWAILEQSDD